MKRIAFVLILPLFMTGCYHAQVTTGMDTSNEVYKKAWAHSFIGGLVPPSVVNAEQHCTNGVARVETKLSFLNMVAQAVTLSLYSPMSITVTCASASAANIDTDNTIEVAKNSPEEVVIDSFSKAIELSSKNQRAAYVSFN